MKLTSIRFASATLLIAGVALFAAAGSASAATVSVQTVKGKKTLVVTAGKRQENTVYLVLTGDGKHVEVEDNGGYLDFSDIVTELDPGAEPGCVLKEPFEDSPEYNSVICEVGEIDQALVLTGDQDDYVEAGDDDTKVPKFPLFVRLGAGLDYAIGGSGNDFLEAGSGRDILEGGKGNDSVNGGAGADLLSGEHQYVVSAPPRKGGNDVIIGGGGRDHIYPGSGRDKVIAGGGNDLISSVRDKDRDTIDCGSGRDDSILGVDNKGIRFKENVAGCERFVDSTFGDYHWTCKGRKCTVSGSVYTRKPVTVRDPV